MDKTIRIVGDVNIPTIHLFNGIALEEYEVLETKKDELYTILKKENINKTEN